MTSTSASPDPTSDAPTQVEASSGPLGTRWVLSQLARDAAVVVLAAAVLDVALRTATDQSLMGRPVAYAVIVAVLVGCLALRLPSRDDTVQVVGGTLQVVRDGKVTRSLPLDQATGVTRRTTLNDTYHRAQSWRIHAPGARIDVPSDQGDVLEAVARHLPAELARELRDARTE